MKNLTEKSDVYTFQCVLKRKGYFLNINNEVYFKKRNANWGDFCRAQYLFKQSGCTFFKLNDILYTPSFVNVYGQTRLKGDPV
jgi:hypothetical protein